jgi:murein tripeptide amidase MpaA
MLKLLFLTMASAVPVRQILSESPDFTEGMFKKLLLRKGLNHLLMPEIDDLTHSLARDFPEIIKVRSIGKTWENRDIKMLEIDARDHLGLDLLKKPAILLTGAHHSRELTSIQMPLYSVLKMVQGLIHGDQRYINLLAQNKYYVVPVVNVDGVATISDIFIKTGKIELIRKNRNPHTKVCNGKLETYGVDLNRNYGVAWD